jgi:hypothetical protein
MLKDGIWWIRPQTRSRRLVGMAAPLIFLVVAPIHGSLRKDGPPYGPSGSSYGAPFHYQAWTTAQSCLDNTDSHKDRGPDEATVSEAVKDYESAVRGCLGDACGFDAGPDRRYTFPHVAGVVETGNGCSLDDEGISGTTWASASGPGSRPVDRLLLVVIAGGLVFLGLIDACSRAITSRTGRQPTSLNGWVTWTVMVGTLATIAVALALFPHQEASVLALTWLGASGLWFLAGQLLFGAKHAAEGLPREGY